MTDPRRANADGRHSEDPLTRLLRDADPAGEAPALDRVERARMRQAVTDAAEHPPEHRTAAWPNWVQPAFAAAAVIAVVGLGLWSLGNEPADAPGTVADGGGTPAPTAPSVTPPSAPLEDPPGPVADLAPSVTPIAPAAAANVDAAATPPSVTRPEVATEPVAQPPATTVAVADTPSPTDRKSRTVQFTAPRGTRIIWTLDPDFESPIAGQDPGREQQK